MTLRDERQEDNSNNTITQCTNGEEAIYGLSKDLEIGIWDPYAASVWVVQLIHSVR